MNESLFIQREASTSTINESLFECVSLYIRETHSKRESSAYYCGFVWWRY